MAPNSKDESGSSNGRQAIPASLKLGRNILALLGVQNPDEAVADLLEEIQHRKTNRRNWWTTSLWTTWQIAALVTYGLKDRMSRINNLSSFGLIPRTALKLSLRRFKREPGSALAAASTLALGFGAAAAILSVLLGFSPDLPVPNGERVVQIQITDAVSSSTHPIDYTQFIEWAQGQTTLGEIGALRTTSVVLTADNVSPDRISAAYLTSPTLSMLGVTPRLGRFPTPDEREVVLLGFDIWKNSFAENPAVIGATVNISGSPHTVIGVMPEGFAFPFRQSLWLPLDLSSSTSAGFEVAALLKPTTTKEQAEADLARFLPAPNETRALSVTVNRFTENRGDGGEKAALRIVLLVTVALLLVSCINVSNLLLVRAMERSQTMAVHTALGAKPQQVVLQMFMEAGLVASIGAGLGLVLAYGAVAFIEQMLSGHWGYYWMAIKLRPVVFLFVACLAVLTAIVSGTIPAIRAIRTDINQLLAKEGPRVSSGGFQRVAFGFLTSQIAISCIVIIASVLMVGGLLSTQTVSSQFPADSVSFSAITLDTERYESSVARRDFSRSLTDMLDRDSIVQLAALTTGLPGLAVPMGTVEIEGASPSPDDEPIVIPTLAVTPDFFELFNIRTLSGENFSEGVDLNRDLPALVSERFAAEYLARGDAVGRRLRISNLAGGEWLQIIGVVSDMVIYERTQDRIPAWVYIPFELANPQHLYITYRLDQAEDNFASYLATSVAAVDPALPLDRSLAGKPVTRIAEILDYIRTIYETAGLLSLAAGLSAILVVAVGLYGVLAFEVQSRVREIGIRMALGADRQRILKEVLKTGFIRMTPGLIAGLLLAFLIMPKFGVLLSGNDPRDRVVFVVVTVGYVLVTFLATALPAKRAAGLDPNKVLQSD